jgi:AmmeMemoRadiSam system protein A
MNPAGSEAADEVTLLDPGAGQKLVGIARRSLELFIRQRQVYVPVLGDLPPELQAPAASFVTLTSRGRLRGCIGSVIGTRPLALDVARNAVAAATSDPRFRPLAVAELDDVGLEVTVLSPLQVLTYADYGDLLAQLRPGVDGVMLTWQGARGLLLPQVWERLTDKDEFLEHVCLKAGIAPGELRRSPPAVTVWTFQVQPFHEPGYTEPE